MKKTRMNISDFRFILFHLKIVGEIVITFQKLAPVKYSAKIKRI